MKLATIRTSEGTAAVRVEDATLTELGAVDVGQLLRTPEWRQVAAKGG